MGDTADTTPETSWYDLIDEDMIDDEQELVYQYEREMGITITLDQALFLLDHPDEETKFKRKQNRMKNCGSWSNWYDPHTGRRTGYFFHCGIFRECPKCLQKRADKELGWLKKAMLLGKIKSLTLVIADQDTISKKVRDIDKVEYLRYPQSNGTDLLFIDPNLGISGESVDLNWVMNQDWKEVVCTPEGRNKSGTIHIPESEKNPDKFSIITTQQFTSSASQDTINGIMDEVVAETPDMNPESAVEVEDYINERSGYAIAKLKERGYLTQVFVKKIKVVHKRISWLVNIKLNTENLTSDQHRERQKERDPIPKWINQ